MRENGEKDQKAGIRWYQISLDEKGYHGYVHGLTKMEEGVAWRRLLVTRFSERKRGSLRVGKGPGGARL